MKKTRASESKNVIGERVRLARRAVRPHVSQEDLSGRLAARGIQITQTGISKLENRQRYVMDYEAVLFHFNSLAISTAPSTRPYSGKFILSGKSNRPRNPAAISRFRSTHLNLPSGTAILSTADFSAVLAARNQRRIPATPSKPEA